jgi:hypothetical protein
MNMSPSLPLSFSLWGHEQGARERKVTARTKSQVAGPEGDVAGKRKKRPI